MPPTKEQFAAWETWLADRPPEVVEVARRVPPWTLYRLSTTGQLAMVQSYSEMEGGGVTLTAILWRDDIPGAEMLFARTVFGLDPAHFVPAPEATVPPSFYEAAPEGGKG